VAPGAAERVTPSVRVLPLGGSNEVGLNATLYLRGADAILVDFGALIGDDRTACVQRIVPALDPLVRDGRRLHGVVLTHGHEDHIGGIPYLLDRLNVPVFGAPLSLALVRSRLERDGKRVEADLRAIPPGARFRLGPFQIEMVSVTHSIPQSAMVALSSEDGRIVHTGDFKLDEAPIEGGTDVARLDELGREGVALLLSDSTNAERDGRSASETSVVEALAAAIGEADGRVVVTFVSSHLHRLDALTRVARRLGRKVLLVGSAFERNWGLGVEVGVAKTDPDVFTTAEGVQRLTPRETLVVATGSQGEVSGAMARLARGEGPVSLEAGDRVIFSARVIPGRETAVRGVVNRLVERGVEVLEAHRSRALHTSGHAQSEEQAELIRRLAPESFAPIHGDRVMIEAHARTARRAGLAPDRIFVVGDGESLWLEGGVVRRGPAEETPRVALDARGDPLSWREVKARQVLARQGALACALVVDGRGDLVSTPRLEASGFDLDAGEVETLQRGLENALRGRASISVEQIREVAVSTLRSMLARNTPVVLVQVVPLG